MTQDDRCFHQPQGLVYNHLECLYKNTINKPLHLPNLRFCSQKKNVRHRFWWFWVSTSPWWNRLLAATIFSTSRPDGVNTSLSAVPVQKATQLTHSDHESNWIISAILGSVHELDWSKQNQTNDKWWFAVRKFNFIRIHHTQSADLPMMSTIYSKSTPGPSHLEWCSGNILPSTALVRKSLRAHIQLKKKNNKNKDS